VLRRGGYFKGGCLQLGVGGSLFRCRGRGRRRRNRGGEGQ